MAELPDEVLERLSTHTRVKFTVGEDGGGAADAHLAPLAKQLFVLVPRGGVVERGLLETTNASFVAEDRVDDWIVRVSGRAVAGRSVQNEPRRAELMHWLPEGALPGGLVAVRFHAESVEYVQGRGVARTRAAGDVPGGKRPAALARWSRLASDEITVWFFAMAVLDWGGLLFLVEEPKRPPLLLVLTLISSACLLGGVTLLQHAARFVRWREGFEPDEAAVLLLNGWDPPHLVGRVGFGMMVAGGLLAAVLAAGAGVKVGVWAVLASGVLLLGPFHLARHALRRRDAAREIG
jgi:hypothetical protein